MADLTKVEEAKEHLKFQAENDVRTLVRAGEIQKDKKRLKRAMEEARSQMAILKKVQK